MKLEFWIGIVLLFGGVIIYGISHDIFGWFIMTWGIIYLAMGRIEDLKDMISEK